MKIALLTLLLALPLAQPAQTPVPQDGSPANVFAERAGCTPVVVQVAGEDREHRGTRLDQQPPAKALLAVDRQVDGCREVTFVSAAERERAQRGR